MRSDLLTLGVVGALALAGARGRRVGALARRKDWTEADYLQHLEEMSELEPLSYPRSALPRMAKLMHDFPGIKIEVIPEGTTLWMPRSEASMREQDETDYMSFSPWKINRFEVEVKLPRPAILAKISHDSEKSVGLVKRNLKGGLGDKWRKKRRDEPEQVHLMENLRVAGYDGDYGVWGCGELYEPDLMIHLFRAWALPVKTSSISGERFIQSMGTTW